MITIKKAKINSVGYLEVEYSQEQVVVSKEQPTETLRFDIVTKGWYSPHQDLLDAFAALRIFLVELCEQTQGLARDLEGNLDAEVEAAALSPFKVTGYTIGGSGEHEGVTLIGRRALANNRVLNLVSPFTKWEDQHNEYDRSWELKQAINKCSEEVEAYLTEYKRAPQPQLSLDFGNDDEDPI